MIVLNVDRKADIDTLSFVGTTRLVVRGIKRTPRRELAPSLWDVTTAAPLDFALPGFAQGSFGQFRSGEWFLGATEDRRGLIAHHPATGRTVVEPVDGTIAGFALTPDGKTVLFSWSNGLEAPNGYGSRAWSDAGAFGPGLRIPFAEHGDGHDLTPLSDGERFVTRGWYAINPHIRTRSVATGDILANGGPAVREQLALAVAPDGRQLVAAVQLSLYLFATGDLKKKQEIRKEGRKHFTGVAFHPSGKYLAATSNDETVLLHNTATWEVARTFTWNIGRMRSIAFSPDGALAAAGSDSGKVVIWDVDL